MKRKVEFDPPQNVSLPEGSTDGEEFDLVCSFRREGNKVCMTRFGDAAMPGYEDGRGREKDKKPDYSSLASGITQQIGGQ